MLKSAMIGLALLLMLHARSDAAEIKLLSANALEPALPGLLVDFEKSSGHKVAGEYRTAGAVADRIQKGEAVDVAIVTGPQNDALQAQGKILQNSRVDIAKVGIGVFVRRGASKPDIGSVDSLKRLLMASKFIAYVDPASGGASGIYMVALIARLGMAAELTPKTKLAAPGLALYETVAKGEADIGFNQISEILAQPSVELIGPLPAEIQNYTFFAAGIVSTSKQIDAGRTLMEFLSAPAAAAVLIAKGLELR